MKRILSLFAVLTLGLILVACGKDHTFDFDKGVLVVGMEADYAPFNWLETKQTDYNYPLDGRPGDFVAGYDVQMAILIAEHLDLELVIKAGEWLALPQMLRTNQIDLIIAGMSPTEDRKENILFSEPYYNVNHVVVAKADGPLANLQEDGLESLEGFKGIGQLNTVYDELIKLTETRYNAVRLPALDSTPALVTAVSGQGADFMIVEKPVALGIELLAPQLKIVFETNDNIFDLTEGDRTLAVGLRLNDTALNVKINEALSTITQATRDALMDEAVSRSANLD